MSDRDLAVLQGFPNLQNLDLRATDITNKGVKNLLVLKKLEYLRVPGQITDAACQELRDALPYLRLDREEMGRGHSLGDRQVIAYLPLALIGPVLMSCLGIICLNRSKRAS